MAIASTNIQQGGTQDDAFNSEAQKDDGTNGNEEASPINVNGKRLSRFTQDKDKRTTLIIPWLCRVVLIFHKKKGQH
jgi:hypothetical protein